jgi:peptidoglycan/LPS O-acetylase OafA/YrhL
MLAAPRGSQASDDLDMIRGVAALGVFLGHARNLFLVDYAAVNHQTLPVQCLYFLTGLGYQWVMVFFVLSGFFISSSVIGAMRQSSWAWSKYLSSRCTRLYVVLIPTLLLTLFWDQLGVALSNNSPVYQWIDEQGIIHNVSERTSFGIFAGNCCFLQTVFVPSLGSNGPLWSLSNEWWYYMLFPCLCLLLARNYPAWKKMICVGFVAVIAYFGLNLMYHFPIWLLGAALAILPQFRGLHSPLVRISYLALGTIGFVGSLVLARINYFTNGLLSDYCVGTSFAILVYVILHQGRGSRNRWYSFCATHLAGMSYTLYLAHLPLLVFLAALFNLSGRWQPDVVYLAILGGICIVVFLYSFVLSQLTEANTVQIRRIIRLMLSLRLGIRRRPQQQDPDHPAPSLKIPR